MVFALSGALEVRSKNVSEPSKRSRDQAESMFSKTQTQAMSLNRIVSEQEAASHAREMKTARLRELRLEKEAEELAAATKTAPKRTGRR
jgi:hypothetical protein